MGTWRADPKTRLGDALNAELVEIVAPAYARGILSFVRAGFDSGWQRDTPRSSTLPLITDYDRVVPFGPVWTSYPAVPLRSFMRAGLPSAKTIGLFLTCAAQSPMDKAFTVAEADLGRPFAATQCLSNADENNEVEEGAIKELVKQLERAESA